MRLEMQVATGLSLVWLLTVAPAPAQPVGDTPPLTLAEARARMMAAHPRVAAARARVDEVRARQAAQLHWPNPTATFSRESVSGASDTFVMARQELPVSGRVRHLRAAGELAARASAADAQAELARLDAELRIAFTTLLVAQEREATISDASRDLTTLLAVLRAREEAGEGSAYDRMRGERAAIELAADLDGAVIARAEARSRLAVLLGPSIVPDSLVVTGTVADASAPAGTIATLIEDALRQRADYRAVVLAAEQAEAEIRVASALRVPIPAATGGMKRSDASGTSRTGYVFSIDAALPLFNRGQSQVAVAVAQRARAAADADVLRLSIEGEVRARQAAAAIHHRRASAYGEAVTASAEPLARVARLAYDEGELGILELLDANRQLLDARLRSLELRTAAVLAAIELDRALGRGM